MNKLGEKSLKTLEYYEILEKLAGQAASQAAKEKCRALRPLDDHEQAELWLQQTTDAKDLMVRQGSPAFGGIREVGAILSRADRGGTLNPRELLAVASLLQTARRALLYDAEHETKTTLTPVFGLLSGNRDLEESITTAIISEEEIADGASPELLSIRRELRRVSGKVRETLNRMISGERSKYLQENIITQRNGRFVVPVKVEHRGDVPGLVHDTSSTGATVFVEPQQVVEINNQIKVLEGREENEIERILAELSSRVSMYKGAIEQDYDALTTLDFIFARAKLSFDMNACAPVLVEDGSRCKLLRARHPLLDKDKAVPIDIAIGYDYDTLVITGPNTGGKTVSLKTVGLLTLMGQSGLHIPTLDRSELALFEEVYADIGDEQSIEQSLSTFSSHMTNVVSFLKKANRHSLVLFDELGAGTDPTEGAALAIAILSHLHEQGIRTMATTHYSELKVYALSTSGVENACCEFDVETLRPTYRLLIGVPGKSNAFAISSKLGLPDYIIDKAKEQISEQDESFEDVLSSLESSRITIENERREIEQYKQEIASLKSEMESKQEKLNEQRDRIIRQANEEAHAVLREAKEYADQTMKMFHKFQKDHVDLSAVEKERQNLRKHMNKAEKGMTQKTAAKKPKKELTAKDISLGDAVKVLSMNLKGTVSSRPDNKGFLFVQMGIIRSKVHISDLELIDEAEITTPTMQRTGAGKIRMSKAAHVSTEINLLGKTVDEAVAELDKYLDDAYIAHLKSVRIVHGKGTGALRKGVHNYLKRQKHVESFRLGEFGEGDAGVTIVEFKK